MSETVGAMSKEGRRARAGLVLVVVGEGLLAVSAYNTYENVAIRGDPIAPAAPSISTATAG